MCFIIQGFKHWVVLMMDVKRECPPPSRVSSSNFEVPKFLHGITGYMDCLHS